MISQFQGRAGGASTTALSAPVATELPAGTTEIWI